MGVFAEHALRSWETCSVFSLIDLEKENTSAFLVISRESDVVERFPSFWSRRVNTGIVTLLLVLELKLHGYESLAPCSSSACCPVCIALICTKHSVPRGLCQSFWIILKRKKKKSSYFRLIISNYFSTSGNNFPRGVQAHFSTQKCCFFVP